MPLHVHREMCFYRVQVKQSQAPEMFETLYSRGVVWWFDTIFCIYWFSLQFWYGHWFLIKLLPASKGDWWSSWAAKPKSKLVRSGCNFCLVVWNLFTLDVNLACGTSSCNWSGLVLKRVVINEDAEKKAQTPGATSVILKSSDVQNPQWTKVSGSCNDFSVCIYIYTHQYNMICSYRYLH